MNDDNDGFILVIVLFMYVIYEIKIYSWYYLY